MTTPPLPPASLETRFARALRWIRNIAPSVAWLECALTDIGAPAFERERDVALGEAPTRDEEAERLRAVFHAAACIPRMPLAPNTLDGWRAVARELEVSRLQAACAVRLEEERDDYKRALQASHKVNQELNARNACMGALMGELIDAARGAVPVLLEYGTEYRDTDRDVARKLLESALNATLAIPNSADAGQPTGPYAC